VRIGIVGGGPSAVEISGNVWQLARDSGGHLPDIHILTGGRMMEGFPESVRSRILAVLARRGIRIVEGDYVRAIRDGRITTASGRSLATDLVFLAMGVKPSGIFSASGLPTGPDGGLQVNRFLQCPAHPEIFGGGDCIHFADQPLDKVGVYAVRQNPVLLHNLTAALEGGGLVPFDPGGDYLLIFNLGGGVGVLRKRSITFGGRAAFWIKDVIDRKFMRKFQAIEAP
jgi:NADH dehydrogenase FAD-containing subunit